MSSGRRRRLAEAGFTLLELMAVVVILALVASLAIPYAGGQSSRTLRLQAQRLAADLELARQRTVVTGIPHRMQIDLEEARYWLEWRQSGPDAGEPVADPEEPAEIGPDSPIDLAPPRQVVADFRPLPNQFGRDARLDEGTIFEGVETPESWIDTGVVSVHFERDGGAEPSAIVLANESGDRLLLEVLPLADSVRIHDASD
jgi:prepilin-type N-terminal cleavage/methylation domain-containing protein